MQIPSEINVAEVVDFVESIDPNSTVYIGCDSERLRINGVWYADFALAVVVHRGNKNGCRVFGAVTRERDYDSKKNRPAYRLMREVQLVADLYLQLAQVLYNDIEVHLDLNPSDLHGSNCVVTEAIGYIRGVCQSEPQVKPYGFAASYAADQIKRVLENTKRESIVY